MLERWVEPEARPPSHGIRRMCGVNNKLGIVSQKAVIPLLKSRTAQRLHNSAINQAYYVDPRGTV